MGIVSRSTLSMRPDRCDSWIEVMPRSERAKLIDLVKLSGTVEGSRRSTDQEKDYSTLLREFSQRNESGRGEHRVIRLSIARETEQLIS